jgi:uncharacterized protein (UPF0548 family)
MRETHRINIDVSEQLWDHLVAISKAASLAEGYHVSVSELIRRAARERYEYGDISFILGTVPDHLAQVLRANG